MSKAESRLTIAKQGLKSECGELYNILQFVVRHVKDRS